MTAVVWDEVGTRFFETGVDRGVLYVADDPGVPWSGIISLSEEFKGGDVTGYFMDGVKYLNVADSEDFAGTLEAYSCPTEFLACEGNASFGGLIFTAQPKKSFGLTYRTLIGSDIQTIDYAYKIHLIYNALAGTPSKDYSTLSDSATPITLSWPITAKPLIIPNVRPTPHLIINSLDASAEALAALEEILYGTSMSDPRMPTAEELSTIFGSPTPPDGLAEDDILDGGSPSGELESVDGGGP